MRSKRASQSGSRAERRTSRGQRGLLRLGALQAGVLLIFQALGFGGFEIDFVLDGCGLRGGGNRVELRAEFGGLLAVPADLPLKTGSQRVFAAERGRGVGGLALRGRQPGFRLGDFRRQRTQLLVEAGTIKIDGLELYEVLNEDLHP